VQEVKRATFTLSVHLLMPPLLKQSEDFFNLRSLNLMVVEHDLPRKTSSMAVVLRSRTRRLGIVVKKADSFSLLCFSSSSSSSAVAEFCLEAADHIIIIMSCHAVSCNKEKGQIRVDGLTELAKRPQKLRLGKRDEEVRSTNPFHLKRNRVDKVFRSTCTTTIRRSPFATGLFPGLTNVFNHYSVYTTELANQWNVINLNEGSSYAMLAIN
jgi:hypothetical protein